MTMPLLDDDNNYTGDDDYDDDGHDDHDEHDDDNHGDDNHGDDEDRLRSIDHILIYYRYRSVITDPRPNGPWSINQISIIKRMRFSHFVIMIIFQLN